MKEGCGTSFMAVTSKKDDAAGSCLEGEGAEKQGLWKV